MAKPPCSLFDEATVPEVDIAGGKIVVRDAGGDCRAGSRPCSEAGRRLREASRRGSQPGRPTLRSRAARIDLPLRGEARKRPMTFRATVLTIFPDMFPGALGMSLAGKALAAGAWSLETVDIRDFGIGIHRQVDDTPAGGGPGMVMKADVLARAIDSTAADDRPRLLMSPRGRPLTQQRVIDLARRSRCGHPVRAVRGRGRARDRSARPRGGVDRRLRAVRRRNRGPGAARCLHPAASRA